MKKKKRVGNGNFIIKEGKRKQLRRRKKEQGSDSKKSWIIMRCSYFGSLLVRSEQVKLWGPQQRRGCVSVPHKQRGRGPSSLVPCWCSSSWVLRPAALTSVASVCFWGTTTSRFQIRWQMETHLCWTWRVGGSQSLCLGSKSNGSLTPNWCTLVLDPLPISVGSGPAPLQHPPTSFMGVGYSFQNIFCFFFSLRFWPFGPPWTCLIPKIVFSWLILSTP